MVNYKYSMNGIKAIKPGFTLAEILITLGIIGVVAALTLPMLIAQYNKIVLSNQLKKAYAEVSQIIKQAESKYGSMDHWDSFDTDTPHYLKDANRVLEEKFMPVISGGVLYKSKGSDTGYSYGMCYDEGSFVQVDRNGAKGQHVWMNNVYVTTPITGRTASIALQDGVCVGFTPINGDYFLVDVIIDVNGVNKKPNMAGKDLFFFKLGKDSKLLPYGYDWDYENLTANRGQACNKQNQNSPGYVCSAKAMADGWQFKNAYPW